MPGSLVAGSLYRVRVRVRPGIRLEEWLRQSAHPLGGVDSRGRAQYPAFAPNTLFCSQIFRNGSWVFGLSVSSVVKNPPANEGNVNDTVSIPGSGRSLGRGHGNPLQHTSLENPTDRGAWRATVQRVSESDTATACTAACLSLVCPSCTCIVIFNPM